MIIAEKTLRRIIREALLLEGPHDKGIFKFIFMAGCPGGGKGSVIESLPSIKASGLRVVNPDDLYELNLKKLGMPLSQPESEAGEPWTEKGDTWAQIAGREQYRTGIKMTGGAGGIHPGHVELDPGDYGYKPIVHKKVPDWIGKESPVSLLERYIIERKGIVLDGTARNYGKIKGEKKILEDLGYDVMMIAVVTPEPVAQERNARRGKDPDKRSLNPHAVRGPCNALNSNLGLKWQIDPDTGIYLLEPVEEDEKTGELKRDEMGNYIKLKRHNKYKELFGENYIEIDNTKPKDEAVSYDDKNAVEKFILSPLTQIAQQWVIDSRKSG